MYLKITVPSESLANAVIETAIRCGPEPLDLKEYRNGERELIFSVYLKATVEKLTECRKTIVKSSYFDPEKFEFRIAQEMATLRSESED